MRWTGTTTAKPIPNGRRSLKNTPSRLASGRCGPSCATHKGTSLAPPAHRGRSRFAATRCRCDGGGVATGGAPGGRRRLRLPDPVATWHRRDADAARPLDNASAAFIRRRRRASPRCCTLPRGLDPLGARVPAVPEGGAFFLAGVIKWAVPAFWVRVLLCVGQTASSIRVGAFSGAARSTLKRRQFVISVPRDAHSSLLGRVLNDA
jgi:hypothetical protein